MADRSTLIVVLVLLALLLLEYLWLEIYDRRKKRKTKVLGTFVVSANKFLQKNGKNNHS